MKLYGNIIYQSEPSQNVTRCVALCEGEINSISSVLVNDIAIGELSGCSYTPYYGTGAQGVDSRFSSDVDGLKYLAYLAVTLATSDKLKGGNPNISATAQGKKVATWDGDAWIESPAYSRNPVACLRDLLTNSRYGAGIPTATIDATTWGAAYDYCDELVQTQDLTAYETRAQLDLTIDSRQALLDVVNSILSSFNGFLVFSGSKIKLQVERDSSVVQAFDMSNIIAGTFTYSKDSKDNLPNRVKVQYVDPSYNYAKLFAQADDPVDQAARRSLGLGEDIVTKTVSLLGITRFSQATRQANLFLNLARACATYCSFSVGPDALGAEVGDVIEVTHDIPTWSAKKFRILGIAATEEDTIRLLCREYDGSIYSGYSSGAAVPSYNTGIMPYDVPPDPTSVTFTELGYIDTDGTWVIGGRVSFTKPQPDNDVQHYVIQLKETGETYANFAITEENSIDIYPLKGGTSYLARIKSVSRDGILSTGEESGLLTTYGDTTKPDDVTGFDVTQSGAILKFSWNAVSNLDLSRYVIKKGGDWSDATTIAELIDTTEFVYPVGQIGTITYLIKAVDTSNNSSNAPASDTITVVPPPERNYINELDLWTTNMEYKHTNTSIVWRNDYNSNYARPTICLDTVTTWEELEDAYATWEAAEDAGALVLDRPCVASGTFEMVHSYDLTEKYSFNVILDLTYKNVSGASLTTYMATSDDGSTWSAWAVVNAATDYIARYVKFKFELGTSNADNPVWFYKSDIFIDAPTVKLTWGKDVAIDAGGTTIEYGTTYITAPKLSLLVVNNVVGFPVVTARDGTEFTVKVYNTDGAAIGTAEVDWEAKGS
jgi:hypothetical protein